MEDKIEEKELSEEISENELEEIEKTISENKKSNLEREMM
jgi:hypothetical protein